MKPMIAEVAVPISFALNEQFDYLIPASLESSVSIGCRVLVPFRASKVVGYVLKLKSSSRFKDKLRSIDKNLDTAPLLDPLLLEIADKIQADYFCSLSEAISAVLPSGCKKAQNKFLETDIPLHEPTAFSSYTDEESEILKLDALDAPSILIHDLSNQKRWTIYSALIKKALKAKKSVIFLVPDHEKIGPAQERLKIDITPCVISSNISSAQSLKNWLSAKKSSFSFVIGTRSAVFAPVNNLGLIIIEEEEHFAFRQDQVPYYRTHSIALFKTKKTHAQLILGSCTPTLESYSLTNKVDKKNNFVYLKLTPEKKNLSIRFIDTRQGMRFKNKANIISKTLEHHIADSIQQKKKMLIFVQKKGFSTFLFCKKCHTTHSCPNCSSSLIYHFHEKIVSCPTCRYKSVPLEICPMCKSSYIKYFGFGEEKVESEISRLFPSVKISFFDAQGLKSDNYDIMLATQKLMEDPWFDRYAFDSVVILGCEHLLGYPDFRSTEKTFAKLLKLSFVAKNEMLIQTQITENDALKYLHEGDTEKFLKNEFCQRKELKLPPAVPCGVLMVRSHSKTKSQEASEDMFKLLKKKWRKIKNVEVHAPVASIPFKVRGNYRNQILIKYEILEPLRDVLMDTIRKRSRGAIVTFDPYL